MSAERDITAGELTAHASPADCWVALEGRVYDLTPFLAAHPGGAGPILACAGRDGTPEFAPTHPGGIIERMGLGRLCVGRYAAPAGVAPPAQQARPAAAAAAAASTVVVPYEKPGMHACLNLFDFEDVARRTMAAGAWAYYSSGADDEVTLRENHAAFGRVWLRPRVLVDVSRIDMAVAVLGARLALPVYISATALGRLAHPDGELALLRAAAAEGTAYMLPTLSSYPLGEVLAARTAGQPTGVQLYVNGDRATSAAYVKAAEAGGCSVLCVTVDVRACVLRGGGALFSGTATQAPQLGRREKDMCVAAMCHITPPHI